MAIINWLGGGQQLLDANGVPLASGKVFVYQPGTLTATASFSDSTVSTENANPVLLDGSGRAAIWLSGNVDIVVKDVNDVVVPNAGGSGVNPDQSTASAGANKAPNPSFEINTSGDGKTPDDWTLTEIGTAVLSSDSALGANAMKFTAATAAAGGGNIKTTSFFEVAIGEDVTINFSMKTSAAGVRVRVVIEWYDSAKVAASTPSSVVYDSVANPTTYATRPVSGSDAFTPPSDARFGKLQMYGAFPDASAVAGDAFFDNLTIEQSGLGQLAVLDIADVLPPGVQFAYGGAAAPSGWLLCDGSAVSRTTYAALFAVIDELYGAGDGSTTFNVPDKRGRVSVGLDDMGGGAAGRVTAASGQAALLVGDVGGDELLQAHTHTIDLLNNVLGSTSPPPTGSNTGSPIVNDTTSSTGGGAAENMPPFETDNWIIKT